MMFIFVYVVLYGDDCLYVVFDDDNCLYVMLHNDARLLCCVL